MADIVGTLKSQNIPVHKPGEEEYERSVATVNLLYRFSRPHCVVQPEHSRHVQEIVKQARLHDLPITIKNGGHSCAGFSTAEKGISLDLSKMNQVDLDMESKTITLKGGALWAHAYKTLINGHHDGYIINGGRCPTVGVSGFILGGGLGPFTRGIGMGCDNLKEATIVTADGKEVTVKDSDDPKSDNGRLFWALCGAGGGNFGIVVELKMSVQRLQSKDGKVVAGRYTWFPKREDMDEFMTTMNDFYTTEWPNKMTIDSSWLCDLQHTTGDLGVRFIVYYDGSKDDFDGTIHHYIKQKDLAKQLKRRSLPETSSRFLHETLVAQWSEETKKAFPSNRSYSIYTSFVFENDKDRIKSITSIIRKEMNVFRELFRGDQGLLQVTFLHSGGEASKRGSSATAVRWREGVYHSYIMIQWDDKWLEKDMRGFCKKLKQQLRPFSIMKLATFINFPDRSLERMADEGGYYGGNLQERHERAYYGDNYQELQRIKKIWDKDDYFNWAQGVRLPKPMPMRMETYASRALTEGSSTEMEGNVDEDEIAFMAADEESSGEEEDLTDMIAKQQWENYTLPPAADLGGIQIFSNLGF